MQADFKPTEIGEIPEDWQVVNLRDIVREFKNGFASGRRDDRGIVQIRMNNVTTDGKVTLNRYLKVPVQGDIQNLLLRSGDLLFNNTNSIDLVGKSAIFEGAPFPCTFSNHFTRIRADETKVVPRWILYHLLVMWKRRRFETLAIRHVGQSAVHVDELSRMNIPLPSLTEQREIVTVLSTVDDAIQKTDEIIAKTQQLKKGLMQQLLTRGIGHTKFKQTELGEVPQEWNVMTLNAISVQGTRNGLYKPQEFFGRGIKVVRMTEIFRGDVLDVDAVSERVELTKPERSKFAVREGDLLFARRSMKVEGSGRCVMVPEVREPMVFESSIVRLTPNKSVAYPKFFLYYLTSSLGRKAVMRIVRTVAVSGVTGEDLGKILVPVPTVGEQQEIAQILTGIDSKLATEEKRKTQLHRIKTGLMQVLLTGKVRVKVN